MQTNSSRISVAALILVAAPLARAADAYSNLDPAPGVYRLDVGWLFGEPSFPDQGFQFTATVGGTVTGLTAAVNRSLVGGQADFAMGLYGNDATFHADGLDHLGPLLETFAGTSTNVSWADTSSLLVPATSTSPAATLQAGAKYWLVASAASDLVWSMENGTGATQFHSGLYEYHPNQGAGAFSIQVNPVPEPSALAALGIAAVALVKRRKRV